jgi:hypothetical protein
MYLSKFLMFFAILLISTAGLANEVAGQVDVAGSWHGVTAIVVFIIAYTLVIGEEFLNLRKSKPELVSAGIIWALVLGHWPRLCRHYLGAFSDQCEDLLV